MDCFGGFQKISWKYHISFFLPQEIRISISFQTKKKHKKFRPQTAKITLSPTLTP